jgi:hypothetical protein
MWSSQMPGLAPRHDPRRTRETIPVLVARLAVAFGVDNGVADAVLVTAVTHLALSAHVALAADADKVLEAHEVPPVALVIADG